MASGPHVMVSVWRHIFGPCQVIGTTGFCPMVAWVAVTLSGGVSSWAADRVTVPKPDTPTVRQPDAARIGVLVERLKASRDDPAAIGKAIRSAESLAVIGAPAVPQLAAALAGEDRDARLWAACILNKIGREAAEAVPALTKALDDDQVKVRLYSARALGHMGAVPRETATALIETLDDQNRGVRHDAAATLLILGRKADALAVLRRALRDGDADVRRSAALAVGRAGPAGVALMPELVQTLRDKDWSVRIYAEKSLGKMGPAAGEAVPRLVSQLKSARWMPEIEACLEALRDIGPTVEGVVPALVWALTHDDKNARPHAAVALGRVRAAEAVPDLIAALDDSYATTRMCSARALGEIGPPARRAIPRLTKLARDDEDGLTREVAQKALKKLRAGP